MSSKLLKKIASGGEFDLVAAIREVATVLTKGPLEVVGSITAASFIPSFSSSLEVAGAATAPDGGKRGETIVPREGGQAGQTGGAKKGKRNVPAITAESGEQQ